MRWHAALLGLFVGTATASCAFLLDFDELQTEKGAATGGSGGSGGSEAGATVPLEELAAKYAQALCKRIDRCLGVLASAALGDEACVEFFEKSIGQSVFAGLAKLTTPDTFEYHPELAPACLAAVENAACDVLFPIPPECDAAIEGKVGAGGNCTHAAECQRGLFCDATPSTCPGKCQPKPGAGKPCAGDVCLEGLVCVDVPGKTCLPPVSAPQADCEGGKFASCRLDMTCLGKAADTPGKCYAISSLFTSTETFNCDWQKGPLCGQGLHCELTSGVTLEGICVKPAKSGAPCKAALPDMCPAGEYCNVTSGVNGLCETLPAGGQPCAVLPLKALCKKGFRCVGRDESVPQTTPGECRGLVGLTDACTESQLCYSGYCVNDACATPNFCSQ